MEDQALYGNVVRILKEEPDRYFIMSAYGYAGYINKDDLLVCSEKEKDEWLSSNLMVTMAISTDVRTAPTVEGKLIITLPRGSLLATFAADVNNKNRGTDDGTVDGNNKNSSANDGIVDTSLHNSTNNEDNEESKFQGNGWLKVRLVDGTMGYVPKVRMGIKRYSEDYLYEDMDELQNILANATRLKEIELGGRDTFSLKRVCDKWFDGNEDSFRANLVKIAKMYMGCQYRWAGRSSFGLDCSGLVSMAYLLNGVIVFRDAKIVKNFPLKKLEYKKTSDGHIDATCFFDENKNGKSEADGSLKIGDALYFPGHIAMYIGDGQYIHSTGYAADMGVTINSLIPGRDNFRQDLYDKLYAVAGVR